MVADIIGVGLLLLCHTPGLTFSFQSEESQFQLANRLQLI